jgi:hypothetical protein
LRIQAILLSRRLKIEGLLSINGRYFLSELSDYFLFNPIKRFIALCQLTAMSISGGFGKKIKGMGQTFLCLNLAHIVASDGHSSGQRHPVLSRAFEEASRIIGRENAWRMVSETPLAIIEGKSLEIPVSYPPRSQRYGRNRHNDATTQQTPLTLQTLQRYDAMNAAQTQ